MINVSAAWHRALNLDNRNFIERVSIWFNDFEPTKDKALVQGKKYYTLVYVWGKPVYTEVENPEAIHLAIYYQRKETLLLTNEDIWQGGFTIDDAVSSDSDFQLGSAIINKFTLVINNIYEKYSDYDFSGAEVTVEVGLATDESVEGAAEYIQKGIYNVDQATYNGSLIRLECLDRMKNFDKPYSESTLVYPASLNQIILDACEKCSVQLGTLDFPHKSYVIENAPEDEKATYREVISWVAQIAGCYARISNVGKLELKWYDRTALEGATGGTDGGVFDETESSSYQTGDSVNGGTFNPWNTGDVLDGGTLVGLGTGVHFISSLYSKDISVDDVIITAVSIEYKTGENLMPVIKQQIGLDGYVVGIVNNPFINEDNVHDILNWLAEQLRGLTFRKASISHGSDPSIEAGDVAIVFDGKGNQYPIVVSRTVFSYGTAQRTVSAAQTPARNSSSRQTAETKNYVELSRKVQAEKSARELAEQSIRSDLASSSGLYYTSVPDEDDPTKFIYYLHNKSALAQSDVRIRFSEGGIAVTSNGTAQNPTWYGLTANGDMITKLLSTTGFYFDWAKGGELTLGGNQNTHGELKILDASGNEIGRWNNLGISLLAGLINLGNGNFVANTNGAVTAKSLTADDYVYVNGNNNSYLKIPTGSGSNSNCYAELKQGGATFVSKEDTVHIYTDNSNFRGLFLTKTSGSSNAYSGLQTAGFISSDGNGFCHFGGTQFSVYPDTSHYIAYSGGDLNILGSLTVNGNNYKSRVFPTKDYGDRHLYCLETPTPMFNDIGEGTIGDDGYCYVTIDPIFAETISSNQYQVFLQKYGEGDAYIFDRKSSYFIVSGTPHMKFAWEIKGKQADFIQFRLENAFAKVDTKNETDFGEEAIIHINQINQERMPV